MSKKYQTKFPQGPQHHSSSLPVPTKEHLEGQPQREDHRSRNSTAMSTVLKERVTTMDSLTVATERPRKSTLD